MDHLQGFTTNELWEELEERWDDGECLLETLPDRLRAQAEDHFYQISYLSDFPDDEIQTEFFERALELDEDEMISMLFESVTPAQVNFIKEKLQEIRDSLINYSYMKAV